jgi:hypothetical protein
MYFRMTDLERDNAMLRGALIFAAREIKRLNFGKRDTPTLRKLRAVFSEASGRCSASAPTGASIAPLPSIH